MLAHQMLRGGPQLAVLSGGVYANLRTLLGNPASPGEFHAIVPAGVVIGSNTRDVPALTVGQFAAGSIITLDVHGSIQGAAGLGATVGGIGGVGGDAVLAQFANQTVRINVHPGGSILGGGGGGGGGGVGGVGGTGGRGYYDHFEWRYNENAPANYAVYSSTSNRLTFWWDGAWQTDVSGNPVSLGVWNRGAVRSTYPEINSKGDQTGTATRYEIAYYHGIVVTPGGPGGAGGAGGAGGRGRGYDNGGSLTGTAGAAGAPGGSGGFNAGAGGAGGSGNWGAPGGEWGQAGGIGPSGFAGNGGGFGNYDGWGPAGGAGATGKAGGAAGRAIVGAGPNLILTTLSGGLVAGAVV